MEQEQFRVSKELLKTITVDSRVQILKFLEDRPMTASELSRFLSKHVTTVTEHLELLKRSNLIERVERPGRKWVYYKLTREGKRVLHPESYRWIMVIAVAFFVFVGGIYIWNVDAYPGQLLYGIKRARENLQLALTSNNLERAEKHIELAEERLKEAKVVAEIGEKELVKDMLKEYKSEIGSAEIEIDEAKNKNMSVVSALEALSEATPKHALILENLMIKTPEVKGDVQPALSASIEGYQSAIQELQNITGRNYTSPIIRPV